MIVIRAHPRFASGRLRDNWHETSLTSVIVLVVAVGVQERPSAAPQEGPWARKVVLFGNPTFAQASAAVSGIVLSFAGTSVHYGILAEMRDPRLYTRAMLICQVFVIVFYLVCRFERRT